MFLNSAGSLELLPRVRDAAERFEERPSDAASAALAGATVNPDLTVDSLDATGDAAYAITTPTYVIAGQRLDGGKSQEGLRARIVELIEKNRS